LADFQRHLDELNTVNASVVAASVDTESEAKKTADRHGLGFAVTFGVDPEAFAQSTGGFWDAERRIVHGTGFLLNPEGVIAAAVYSTGPIGRFAPTEVIGMIKYLDKA
jgi:peroxiredoxin